MNWLYRIFNWRKSPKATNEMKPVDMSKYTIGVYSSKRLEFIKNKYWKVKKSWKRSPKNYTILYSFNDNKNGFILVSNNRVKIDKNLKGSCVIVGNLYELYQQYYGKENKSKS